MNTNVYNNYMEQFEKLKELIVDTNKRAVNNPDDDYITSSINFFRNLFLLWLVLI